MKTFKLRTADQTIARATLISHWWNTDLVSTRLKSWIRVFHPLISALNIDFTLSISKTYLTLSELLHSSSSFWVCHRCWAAFCLASWKHTTQ